MTATRTRLPSGNLNLLGEQLVRQEGLFPGTPVDCLESAWWQGPTLRLFGSVDQVGPGETYLHYSVSTVSHLPLPERQVFKLAEQLYPKGKVEVTPGEEIGYVTHFWQRLEKV
jgi:hypothetical protein